MSDPSFWFLGVPPHQVKGYGVAFLLYRKDGVDISGLEELAVELKRRKKINLLDNCDVDAWDPRPVSAR